MAGSSHTLTSNTRQGSFGRIETAFVGDDSNGTVPTLAIQPVGDIIRFISIETNPGSTGPSDNYDITLLDANGGDVLSSAGLNRDTSNTEIANIALTSHVYFSSEGPLTLTVANTSVNGATGVIILKYQIFPTS